MEVIIAKNHRIVEEEPTNSSSINHWTKTGGIGPVVVAVVGAIAANEIAQTEE